MLPPPPLLPNATTSPFLRLSKISRYSGIRKEEEEEEEEEDDDDDEDDGSIDVDDDDNDNDEEDYCICTIFISSLGSIFG